MTMFGSKISAMAAIALGAAVLYTSVPTPAAAQVGLRAGENGVSVRIGEPHRHMRDRRDMRDRRYHRERDRRVYNKRAQCREVTVRERRPNGTVVSRTRTTC